MVLGEAGGCGTEGGGVGAVSDGGGGERKKVGDGVPGVEVEVFGEEDGVQEVVRGPEGGGGGGTGGDCGGTVQLRCAGRPTRYDRWTTSRRHRSRHGVLSNNGQAGPPPTPLPDYRDVSADPMRSRGCNHLSSG